MKRTHLHHYQRNSLGDAGIMRSLVEDKAFYDSVGGMLSEEKKSRHRLLANVVDYDHIEGVNTNERS